MALKSALILCVENKPGSFGETMNEIRAWLDHHRIEPSLFKAAISRG